jgi:hypothetical protein
MSAFIDLPSFRKSGLFKKGDITGTDMSAYQDPTYLSFTLLFDMQLTSPLFNGEAAGFMKKHLVNQNPAKYQHKLDSLLAFKEALYKINSEMPWHWQSLAGVERMVQFTPENPFFGGDDAKLTIGCLETINLNISGLMQLYRKAVWDESNWRYILPPNLRKFTMYLFISDVRGLYDNSAAGVLTGENLRPFFMFELRFCEFDMTSGNKALADLSAASPEAATNEIIINYNRVYRVDARALNGAIFQSKDISKKDATQNIVAEKETIVPVLELENKYNDLDRRQMDPEAGLDPDTAKEIAELEAGMSAADPAQAQKLSMKQNLAKGMKNLKNKAKDKLKETGKRATEDLTRMAKFKAEEAEIEARRLVNRRIPTLENIYGKAIRALDAATDIKKISAAIESTVGRNVHFLNGTPLVDVLNKANRDALINIGNVYKR